MSKLLYSRSLKDGVWIKIFYTELGEVVLDVIRGVVGLQVNLNVPKNIDDLDNKLIDTLNELKFGMYLDEFDNTINIKSKVTYVIEKINQAVMNYYPRYKDFENVVEHPDHSDIINNIRKLVNQGPTGNPVVICNNEYARITLASIDRNNNTALLTMVKHRSHWFLNKFTGTVNKSDLKQRIEEILLWDGEVRNVMGWV